MQSELFTAAIVEDNIITVRFLQDILEEEGVQVTVFEYGRDFRRYLEQNNDLPDLLFLDLLLPDINGLSILEEIHTRKLPIIVSIISAVNDVAAVSKAYELGIREYFLKPLRYIETRARIKSLLSFLRIERQNKRHLEEIQKLYKQQQKFFSVLSHDIRSPLSTIKGIAELLRDEPHTQEEVQQFAQEILQITNQIFDLTSDILELFHNVQIDFHVHLQPIEVLEFTSQSIDAFRFLAYKKNIELVFDYSHHPQEIWIQGNPPQFQQVLNNLLSNAIKFTPKGGKVIVRVRKTEKTAEISVIDTGIGIPPDIQNILFTESPEKRREGTAGEKSTGLGLIIVKNIVESMNGEIAVDSAPGKGTTFTLRFPFITPNMPETEDAKKMVVAKEEIR